MSGLKPCGAHIFHASCWTILSRQLEENIDLDKLFDICNDVAPSGRNASYEDMSISRLMLMTFITDLPTEMAESRHIYPLEQPDIRNLQGIRDRSNFQLTEIQLGASQDNLISEDDCFRSLPPELRSMIVNKLTTLEFFNLREVSRSMGEDFEDQLFWKTRFLPCGERGFLNSLLTEPQYEPKEGSQASKPTDWRLIYRSSAKLGVRDAHIWELRRRWHNNRWLSERYSMTKASDEEIRSHGSLFCERKWKTLSLTPRCDRVRSQVQAPGRGVCGKCAMTHIPSVQAVPLDTSVSSLVVYVLRESYYTNVTGIGLLEKGRGEPSLILGYRIPDQYVLIDIDGKELRGFNIFAGRHAIYAIQAVFRFGCSKWAGNQNGSRKCQQIRAKNPLYDKYRDTPRFVRLTTKNRIQALSAKLDYCKLIELGISKD
ncbi:unnamed protein product [Penicillium olsonii]|uniref:F-box domain-containing protein n=1 Tax=Penicillium olsonii TaxID=99116 RepID=A0A9W4MWR9_PENOL|nr:unnamed protein product [Penicillium olsonii]CAG8213287.1 unnamed protein product [Penicillium olsonii]